MSFGNNETLEFYTLLYLTRNSGIFQIDVTDSHGSFTPKLNLQPTGFRLVSNWLQTSSRQVKCSWVTLV